MAKREQIIYETRTFEEAREDGMQSREGLVVDKIPLIVVGERWTIDRYSHGQGVEDTRCWMTSCLMNSFFSQRNRKESHLMRGGKW